MTFTDAPFASTSNGESTASSSRPVSPSKRLEAQRQRLLEQRDVLDRLSEGEGIAKDEWDGLVEKCYVCNKIMLEAFFKLHSRECWHLSEEESEVDKWGI
jgi:hypothetical protein